MSFSGSFLGLLWLVVSLCLFVVGQRHPTIFQILWRTTIRATDSNWSNRGVVPALVADPAAGSSESSRISFELRDFLKCAVIAFGMSDRPDQHTDVNAKQAHTARNESARKDQEASMLATRESLPATRDSITHKFCIDRYEGYLMIGLYADGRPGEIFIKMAKEGSTISGLCQAFCRAFSLAIQHGLSINEAVARFKDMRFEPMGSTSNPEIPEAASIVDYVARYLELHFSEPTRGTRR